MPFIPLLPMSPASGIGKFYKKSAKIIRFAKYGCANRPFYHIVVMEVILLLYTLNFFSLQFCIILQTSSFYIYIILETKRITSACN